MLDDVGGELAHRAPELLERIGAESVRASHVQRMQLDGARLQRIADGIQLGERWRAESGRDHGFHRTMVTQVPTPTVDSSSNSLTRRRAPGRPRPRLPPVENPS